VRDTELGERRGIRATYGWLARERAVRSFLVASIAARLAFAMLPLGLLLFVVDATGSIAAAGAAAGAWGLGSTLHPLRGRLVDRGGPRVLVGFVLAFAAGLVGLVVIGGATVAAVPIVAVAAVVGLVIPPVGPFARAVWGAALRPRPNELRAAFAADSVLDEATLVLGPLFVGAIVALGSPALSILAAAAAMALAGTATALAPLARALHEPPTVTVDAASDTAAAGRAGGLVMALAALGGAGLALGALEVTFPAFASARGTPAAAGVLAGALSAGSVIAGVWYGAHGGRGDMRRRFALWAALFAAALIPLLAAQSVLALGVLLIVPGLALGPLWIVLFTFVDAATPPGSGTRVFGWVVAVNNAGVAAGAALGGVLIAAHDSRAGLLLAVAGGAIAVAAAAGLRAGAPRARETGWNLGRRRRWLERRSGSLDE
jgi:hypothetical protein